MYPVGSKGYHKRRIKILGLRCELVHFSRVTDHKVFCELIDCVCYVHVAVLSLNVHCG